MHARAIEAWLKELAGRRVAVNSDVKTISIGFVSLLRSSLRQHQYFWQDHGVFTPLPGF
jgi:hypothetical protein